MPELVAKGSQRELCACIAEPGHVARQGVLVQQYDREGALYLVGKVRVKKGGGIPQGAFHQQDH